MKRRKSPYPALIALVLIATLIGVGFSINVVRKEGWDGLWSRKKEFVKAIKPDAGPTLDEAEKQAKSMANAVKEDHRKD